MRVYIAGPMSGYPDHNFAAFWRAEALLEVLGHEVVNPARINGAPVDGLVVVPGDAKWVEYMQNDIKQLIYCNGIYLLKGWDKSRGASLEFEIASRLGFEIFTEAKAGE